MGNSFPLSSEKHGREHPEVLDVRRIELCVLDEDGPHHEVEKRFKRTWVITVSPSLRRRSDAEP